MNSEHEEKIILTLTPYLMAFPQSKLTKEGLVVYAKALSSLSIAEINAAMLKLMRTCRFFPTVAEIFEQAAVMRDFAAGKGIPTPDEAWREAMREMNDKFVYGKWELSTHEIEQAVDNFGKMALCELTPEGMNTARAQFMRIYASIVSRAKEKATNRQVLNLLPQRQVAELLGDTAKKLSMGG